MGILEKTTETTQTIKNELLQLSSFKICVICVMSPTIPHSKSCVKSPCGV